MKSYQVIILIIILLTSCAKKSKIEGLKLVDKWDMVSPTNVNVEIWDSNKKLYENKLYTDTIIGYSMFTFYHTKEALLCRRFSRDDNRNALMIEYSGYDNKKLSHKQGINYVNEIISIDFYGNFLESIFAIPHSHYVEDMGLSESDDKLVYSYVYYDTKKKDFVYAIGIVDLITKKVIDIIDNVDLLFLKASSIWSPDGDELLLKRNYDLYIYNIEEKTFTLLEENTVKDAEWSSNGKYISYLYDGAVYIYDIGKNKKKRFYKPNFFEGFITYKNWVNRGEYIFIESFWSLYDEDLIANFCQKLYEVKTKERIKCEPFNIDGYYNYGIVYDYKDLHLVENNDKLR